GDNLHVGIEDRAPEVEALADDVVVGGLDHGDPHPLGGGIERGADHLHGHRVERLVPHGQTPFATSITRQALPSTRSRSPGSSRVWVPDSSIAAGPSITSPARSRSRPYTRYSSRSRSSVEEILRVSKAGAPPLVRSS